MLFSHRCLTIISYVKHNPSLGMWHRTCRRMVFPTTPTKSDRIPRGNRRRRMVGGNRRRRAAAGRAKRSASNELHRLPNLCYTARDDWRESDMNCPVFCLFLLVIGVVAQRDGYMGWTTWNVLPGCHDLLVVFSFCRPLCSLFISGGHPVNKMSPPSHCDTSIVLLGFASRLICDVLHKLY